MPRAKKKETAGAISAENINYVKPVTDFPFVYANNVTLSLRELDASLIFGEVVGEEEGKTMVIPKVKVIMALPFLKKLGDLLTDEAVKAHFLKISQNASSAE